MNERREELRGVRDGEKQAEGFCEFRFVLISKESVMQTYHCLDDDVNEEREAKRQTGIGRDKQEQTEIDTDRHREAETDRDRYTDTDRQRKKKKQTETYDSQPASQPEIEIEAQTHWGIQRHIEIYRDTHRQTYFTKEKKKSGI